MRLLNLTRCLRSLFSVCARVITELVFIFRKKSMQSMWWHSEKIDHYVKGQTTWGSFRESFLSAVTSSLASVAFMF